MVALFGWVGASAQMVGTDCFLQGHWVEVGINQMGGFGTCTSPITYHTHSCCFPTVVTFTPGAAMDMSYDWGHDGWGTGSPALMGPYSQPGYPQEGWSLQVGATEYRNGAWGGLCTGEYDVPGTMTGYSNAGGVIKGTWTGGVAGLSLRQETRIDTEGSWIIITTIIRNTTAAPIADIYYERTLDPDNVSFWGAGPVTRNRIVHQNEDARHRVMVSANGESAGSTTVPAYDSVNSYLALATKDCRAKCGYLASGLTPTTTPAFLWALPTTAPDIGALGSNNLADVGIWLTFNIGTIAANDSAAVSYAYIFDRKTSIDSAFPDPRIVINGVEKLSEFPPTPDYDTFSACTTPGLTVLPVSIKYGDERCWTWGKWTWAPSTGLASTTGVTNNITIAALSGPTTFTITGTDSSIGMYSCNTKVFYLTVFPCFSASSNSPDSAARCEGDTLHLYSHGDSLGATYQWYGPGLVGATIAATQNTFKLPSAMADTGWYYVIRTIGTSSDTASTHVMIKKRPYVTATYNPPVCSGNPLLLYSNPDYAGETWSWTGPLGYTSTASDPTIPGAITGMSGDYKVITNLNGCIDSATVTVAVDTTPAVPIVSSNSPVCADSTLFLTSSTATPGVTYSWTGPSGFTSTLQNPSIPSVSATNAGTYSVTVSRGICNSSASTVVSVNVTPVPIVGSNSPICSGGSLNLTTTGLPGSVFAWSGPLGFTSTLQYPSISPAITANSGTYSVVVTLAGCPSQIITINTVVDSTPEVPVVSTNSPGPPGATICQEDTLLLFANSGTAGVSYSWTGPNSFTSFAQNPIIYGATPLASGVYTVVV
ncbi:MAG: hypothetical protein IAE95_04175, partial [Chitinophagaceae bacterium]|nr:hypothetical protein [Chitinophagaceae bacterium]